MTNREIEKLKRFRRFFLRVSQPITKAFSSLRSPWSRKCLTSVQYGQINDVLKPGMALCTRTNGEFSNLFIPGYWSHAAIYVGNNQVVEAVGKGVVVTNLIDFVLTKDAIVVREPRFADTDEMEDAAQWALSQVGKGYDMYFDKLNLDYFYCSELVSSAYEQTMEGLMPFGRLDTVWGMPTILPEDIVKADKQWQTVYSFIPR